MNKPHALVLVHGLFNSSSVMKPLSCALKAQGFCVYSPDLVPCNGSVSIATLAHQLDAFIQTHLAGKRFSLIAFSMGGLVARYFLQCLNHGACVQTFITLGTPHHGSALAFFRTGDGFRDLRQGSALLRMLKQTETHLLALNPLSIYTPFDTMIMPYTSAIWRVATNVSVPLLMHCSLLSSPKVHRLIFSHLSQQQFLNSNAYNRSPL